MIRFDQMPPEIMAAMCTPMHEILSPNPRAHGTGTLYLGSLSATMDASLLKEHRIALLVQVLDAPWLPDPALQGLKLDIYRMDILDLPSADLKPHLDGACDAIASALARGLNVLVHCQQGISRSAAVVIAYLISKHGMSYDQAYAYVREKRACIKPNPGFVACLRDWEKQWHGPQPAMTRRHTTF